MLTSLSFPKHDELPLLLRAWFKDSAESETSRPSRIRLGPLRDESESRVGRLNSEETEILILCLIAIQCENNYISMYL